MVFQSITLNMPEQVYRRAKRAADALQRPIEEVILDTLNAALFPIDDAPPEMEGELATMSGLPDEALWNAAQNVMPAIRQSRFRALSEAGGKRLLKTSEKSELDELRKEYGMMTLRKAHAYALLRRRGLYSPTSAQ